MGVIFVYSDILGKEKYQKLIKKLKFIGLEIKEFSFFDKNLEEMDSIQLLLGRLTAILSSDYYYYIDLNKTIYHKDTNLKAALGTDNAILKECYDAIIPLCDEDIDDLVVKTVEELKEADPDENIPNEDEEDENVLNEETWKEDQNEQEQI